MPSEQTRPAAVQRTLVRVGTTLRDADVPFAFTGGSAVYARGGPFSEHDVDVLVRRGDIDHAVRALVKVGMRAADAPEDWLRKVYDGDVLVDLIHRPAEQPVTDEMLAGADELQVGPLTAPVAPATDVLVQKLLVLGPHYCDYTWVLPAARALREQVEWEQLVERTAHSPYAEAFLLLADRLQIAPGIHNGGAR
ncbi:MAG TPA: hypothetical protein VHH34_06675 [Pseudonocardiaceae bacterium]|nr:hypothetical protein [Pseudonocardiaceae bacterium]